MQTHNFAAPNLPVVKKHGGLIFVLGLDVAPFLGSLAGQLAQPSPSTASWVVEALLAYAE